MIGANTDPARIQTQIVNSIGSVFLFFEIVHLDGFGLAPGMPFAAAILVFPYLFLLFRVHRNRRLSALQERRCPRINMLKLRIAVRMRRALFRLAVRLQAVFLLVQ